MRQAADENRLAFDAVLEATPHPPYEIIATGQLLGGVSLRHASSVLRMVKTQLALRRGVR